MAQTKTQIIDCDTQITVIDGDVMNAVPPAVYAKLKAMRDLPALDSPVRESLDVYFARYPKPVDNLPAYDAAPGFVENTGRDQAAAAPDRPGEAMQRHINRTHNPKSSDNSPNRGGRVLHGGGIASGRERERS